MFPGLTKGTLKYLKTIANNYITGLQTCDILARADDPVSELLQAIEDLNVTKGNNLVNVTSER